ncbi:hypothetical protein CEXT_743141 [Caerostris extrusa]|uniref:Uncharacterized protein n=1 Tax=Caerostris extrusa TaxID=172846 RepID=A0AAV4UJ77_CAEEX|nr:hypothetical protein CEXT_743141 [Caerostris extrusa]
MEGQTLYLNRRDTNIRQFDLNVTFMPEHNVEKAADKQNDDTIEQRFPFSDDQPVKMFSETFRLWILT